MPDRLLERTLNEKMVRCSIGDGPNDCCKWEGKLSSLDDHLKVCSHQKDAVGVPCDYCFDLFAHSKVIAHQKECPSRLATCEFCKTHKDTLLMLKSEHYALCSEFPVPCPNGCGAEIPRKDSKVWKHINEICPNTVLDCPFKYAGCKVQLSRREMPAHSSNDNLSEHLSMTKGRIQKLEEEAETMKRENETMNEENENLKEEIESLRENLDARHLKYLAATDLPSCANEGMLKSLFGQHGPVQNILHKEDLDLAIIEYRSPDSAEAALSYSQENGINLKFCRLGITPLYL